MQAGTIEWNGLDLARAGDPELTIRRMPDPPPPAQATRQISTLSVRVHLKALDPSRLQAVLELLQRSMHVAEGTLRQISPGGHALTWTAIPSGDNLGEALRGRTATVDMEFTATEAYSSTDGLLGATFTPDGGDAIPLSAIRDERETVSTDRHSPLAAARRLTTVTLSFTARAMQADPSLAPAERMTALRAKAEELRALNCVKGTLTRNGVTHVVQVQSLTPDIDAGRHVLDLGVQLYYTVFPAGNQAEASLNIETRDTEGEDRMVVVSGTVDAETEAIANAKVDAIRARHTTAGRRILRVVTTPAYIDGADTRSGGEAAEAWAGSLAFSIEFRELADATRWKLKVATRENVRGGMTYSYSGTVTASTAEAALTKARELGGNAAHPFRVSAEEVIDTSSAPGSADSQFVSVAFAYEYEGPAVGFLFAEISSDRSQPLFSERRTNLSGYIVAPTSTDARAFFATLMTAYDARTPVDVSERESELAHKVGEGDTTRQAVRLEFSRSYPDTHSRVAAKYVEEDFVDDASMTTTTSANGTIWTDSRAHAETALTAVLASIFGTGVRPHQLRKGHPQESWGPEGNFTSFTAGRWIQLDFSATLTTKTAGAPGFDIIEARFTATRDGAINRAVIHEIPGGRPVAQVGIGYTSPTFRISASCRSRTEAAGMAWVQGLRSKAPATNRHEIAMPQETVSPEFEPFSGTNVLVFVTTANYAFAYSGTAAQMDGLWPGGLSMG